MSLVEILIALFVFLIGILGVLSLFPVAMNSAGRAIGEVRTNVVADSALAQLTSDCRTAYETGIVSSTTASSSTTLVRDVQTAVARDNYYVTLTSGLGKGQCRFIPQGNDGLTTITLAVTTPWMAVGTWSFPQGGDAYVITRLGLPDPPLLPPPTATAPADYYREFGVNRSLAIFAFVGPNGLCAGLPWAGAGVDPFSNGGNEVRPFIGDTGTVTTVAPPPGADYIDAIRSWTPDQYRNYYVRIVSGPGAGQTRRVTGNAANKLTVSPPWVTPPHYNGGTDPSRYEIGWGKGDTGTPTVAGAGNTLTDTTKSWAPDQFADCYVRIVSGAGAGQSARVTTNSLNQLTVTPAWGTALDTTTSIYFVEMKIWSGTSKSLAPATGGSANTLQDTAAVWAADVLRGKYVYVAAGPCAGQARAIVANTADTVTVTPNFAGAPTAASQYSITESHGYVLITSGRGAGRLLPIAWDGRRGPDFDFGSASSASGGDANYGDTITGDLTDSTKSWAANYWQTYCVRVVSGPGAGQFRTITGNTNNKLTVAPNWTAPGPDGSSTYEILSPGHRIVCAGADFVQGGASAAQRITGPGSWNYSLQNAASFTVVGNGSPVVRDALPLANAAPPLLVPVPVNVFNRVRTSAADPLRVAADVFGAADSYGSEYSYAAIFSDSGALPGGPVRADVFVFRNFDAGKDLAGNQKTAGFITGYIGRP